LEEPPPHVKFLLATTDPQRLPVTILSRCLQFNLKRLPASLIAQHLGVLLDKEGIAWEGPALMLIARAGDGSMRDALSLLDQAIAFGGGRVELKDVSDMLGTIDQHHVLRLLDALARGDAGEVLGGVTELAQLAPDYGAILAELISLLQRVAIAQVVPEHPLDGATEPDEIRRLAQRLSPEDVQLFYQIALIGRRDLPLAPEPCGGLEMILLRMLCFRPTTTSLEPSGRSASHVGDVERSQIAGASSPPTPGPDVTAISEPEPVTAVRSGDCDVPVSPVPDLAAADWKVTVERLGLKGIAQQLALNCVPEGQDGDTLRLILDPGHAQARTSNGEERLRAALQKHYGRALRLRIEIGTPATATPARQQAQSRAQRQQAAEETIARDPNVQALRETFDARVRPGSVGPAD
jgi:DNA polymerase-3 subunit gamma/tau